MCIFSISNVQVSVRRLQQPNHQIQRTIQHYHHVLVLCQRYMEEITPLSTVTNRNTTGEHAAIFIRHSVLYGLIPDVWHPWWLWNAPVCVRRSIYHPGSVDGELIGLMLSGLNRLQSARWNKMGFLWWSCCLLWICKHSACPQTRSLCKKMEDGDWIPAREIVKGLPVQSYSFNR